MLKRSFDVSASAIGLLLFFPLLFIIAFWIKLDTSGPVFYRQERVGQNGRLFRIHKFRTMRLNADIEGRLTVGRDARITRSGKFLRKYKLDELPQLLDVIVGDMSLVGPRPEVQEFMDYYPTEVRSRILSVKPGITDMASIEMINENDILGGYENYREAYVSIILPIKQKYYLEYVENRTLWLDIYIIFKTILKIIYRF